jgi:hypothetical protein
LTEAARVATELPTTLADSEAYFSSLAAPLRTLVSQAEQQGHCSRPVALRLLTAIDQMISLAARR